VSPRTPTARTILCSIAVILIAAIVGIWTFAVLLGTSTSIRDSYGAMSRDVAETNDFPMFYTAGENVVSVEREHAYEKQFIVDSILRQWTNPESLEARELLPWLRYYNPPFYLFALSPLTFLDMHEAYVATVAINLAALAALLFLSGVTLKRKLGSVFFLSLTTFGYMPLVATIYHGQPTLVIAALTLGAFLLAQKGRTTVASLLVSLCAAKPQLAIAAALPLLRDRPRAVVPLALIGAAITLAPFAVLGAGAMADYFHLVSGRGGDDLAQADYASHVLSWPGFMVALTGSLQPVLSAALSLLTLVLLAIILRRGDRFLTWPASIVAILAVLPHSHPQDWMLTVPAAVIVLARPMHPSVRVATVGLLAVAYIAVNSWVFSSGIVYDGGRALYAPTPMALVLLGWFAALPLVERRLTVLTIDRSLQPAASPA